MFSMSAEVFAESFVSGVPRGEYRLSKYDVINIIVIGVSEGFFSDKGSDIVIGPDGYVNLPYAGNLKLAGLTIPETQQLLKEKLGEYLQIPSLSVMVKHYGTRKIYVVGEVGKQGIYEMNPEYMNVFAAISSAGGITNRGRPKHIKVIRTIDGKMQMQEVNFDRFIEQQDASQNVALLDGDMIYVPKSDKIVLSEDVMPYISMYGLYKSITQ